MQRNYLLALTTSAYFAFSSLVYSADLPKYAKANPSQNPTLVLTTRLEEITVRAPPISSKPAKIDIIDNNNSSSAWPNIAFREIKEFTPDDRKIRGVTFLSIRF